MSRSHSCGHGRCGVCGDAGAARRLREEDAALADEREDPDPRGTAKLDAALARADAWVADMTLEQRCTISGKYPEETGGQVRLLNGRLTSCPCVSCTSWRNRPAEDHSDCEQCTGYSPYPDFDFSDAHDAEVTAEWPAPLPPAPVVEDDARALADECTYEGPADLLEPEDPFTANTLGLLGLMFGQKWPQVLGTNLAVGGGLHASWHIARYVGRDKVCWWPGLRIAFDPHKHGGLS